MTWEASGYHELSHMFHTQSSVNMEARIPTKDFLLSIDVDLIVHTEMLERQGFTSTKSLKYLRGEYLGNIPEVHKRMILDAVQKLGNNEQDTEARYEIRVLKYSFINF